MARYSIAVTMPSRPKGVLYQGTPAYGNGPSGLSLVSITRSAAERAIQSLNWSLEV